MTQHNRIRLDRRTRFERRSSLWPIEVFLGGPFFVRRGSDLPIFHGLSSEIYAWRTSDDVARKELSDKAAAGRGVCDGDRIAAWFVNKHSEILLPEEPGSRHGNGVVLPGMRRNGTSGPECQGEKVLFCPLSDRMVECPYGPCGSEGILPPYLQALRKGVRKLWNQTSYLLFKEVLC